MQAGYTHHEIATQLDAWNNALEVLHAQREAVKTYWQNNQFDHVIFTGCGSTHYLALTAANLMQGRLGVPSRAVPASELILHPQNIYTNGGKPLLITISRSAETTETVQAAREFKKHYGDHILAITCYDERPLNEIAQLNLVAPVGQEQSIAQTRSFSSMLVLIEGMIDAVKNTLTESLTFAQSHQDIQTLEHFAKPYADPERFNQYFYLGSGARYGLAAEAMLKMKEMSLTHAEAYHPLEFRHGPMSMVDEKTLIVGLLGTNGYQTEREVLKEMQALGGTILCVSPHDDADYIINTAEDTPIMVQYMPVIQWLAYSRSIQKGLNPDRPRHLESVVHLQDGFSNT